MRTTKSQISLRIRGEPSLPAYLIAGPVIYIDEQRRQTSIAAYLYDIKISTSIHKYCYTCKRKYLDRGALANSVDPDQTRRIMRRLKGPTLFAAHPALF